jgi:hypothetical protein
VNANITVKAVYTEVEKYLVIFEGKDGAIIDTQMVYRGESAIAPTPPAVLGYDFISWDSDFSNVSNDMTVKAIYEVVEHYRVKFYGNGGNFIGEYYAKKGTAAVAPEPPEIEGYVFVGWDEDISCITSNLYVYAKYEPLELYTVKFVGLNGEILSEQKIYGGQDAQPPVAPSVVGYVFVRWDGEFTDVSGDTTVLAVYDQVGYFTVTFCSKDGDVIYEHRVNTGCAASAPVAPKIDGYTFVGWDKDFSAVTEDLRVNAVYEAVGGKEATE